MKALNITTLDVRNLTTMTDTMLIATGTSNRHVAAITDQVLLQSKRHQVPVIGVEGKERGEWVLIDLGDVLIHVMQQDIREFYQLERLWTPIESDERRM